MDPSATCPTSRPWESSRSTVTTPRLRMRCSHQAGKHTSQRCLRRSERLKRGRPACPRRRPDENRNFSRGEQAFHSFLTSYFPLPTEIASVSWWGHTDFWAVAGCSVGGVVGQDHVVSFLPYDIAKAFQLSCCPSGSSHSFSQCSLANLSRSSTYE